MTSSPREILSHVAELIEKGVYDEAQQVLEELSRWKGLSTDQQLSCRLLESTILIKHGNLARALELTKAIMAETREQGKELFFVDAQLIAIEVYWKLGKLDEGLEAVDQVENLLKTVMKEKQGDYTQREADLLSNKGNLYWKKGEPDRALEYHHQSLVLREKHGVKQKIANSLINIGNMHHQKADLDKALNYYQKSLRILEELGNKQFISIPLNNIGVIYRRKGDLNQALNYYQRSLAIDEEIGNKQDIAYSFNNIGLVYQNQGELDLALEFHQRSLTYREELGNKQDISRSINNIGLIYWQKGETVKALNLLEEALAIREKIGNDFFISGTLFELIGIAADIQDHDLIQDYLERLRVIEDRQDDPNISQLYRVARAITLKNRKTLRHLFEAGEILEQIVDEEVITSELTTTAILHLCDLLFFEIKILGAEESLLKLKTLTDRLVNTAKESGSYSLLSETFLMQSRLALLDLDVDKAQRLITKARITAEEKDLVKLMKTIANEEEILLENISSWDRTIEGRVAMSKMNDLLRIDDLINRMIRSKVYKEERELIEYTNEMKELYKKWGKKKNKTPVTRKEINDQDY